MSAMSNKLKISIAALALAVTTGITTGAATAHAQTTLGTFTFSDGLFGNSLSQSDNGAWANANYLSTTTGMVGAPNYLTGTSFNTGVANIGLFNPGGVTYTIGYDNALYNNEGSDLGVVMARFSSDWFDIAVSTDGTTFSAAKRYTPESAVGTGASRSYYFAGNNGNRYDAMLYVQPVDLSFFGLGIGDAIRAIRITGYNELDLIRVAGFETASRGPIVEDDPDGPRIVGRTSILEETPDEPGTLVTPEPTTYALMAAGLAAMAAIRRRTNGRGSMKIPA